MSYAKHDDTATSLKSTGKSAKKRRVGVVVGDDEAESEDDDEDDFLEGPEEVQLARGLCPSC